ncbi:TolB family protein [Streptomyces sparsogenes]|uniref:TolB family protein n=1 Tax=Streptomyces sparsogenes TaxID=67365 RepID=UPI0033E6B36A
MNAERLVRDTLREWAEETPPPAGPDLAGRALRRRRRRRATALSVGAAAFALLVGGVAVPVLADGHGDSAVPAVNPYDDVSAHPDESPPRHLIAAGNVAVSAYQAGRRTLTRDGVERTTYTWYLYSPRTQRYEKTPWGWLDVAPGMKRAAVLEKTLPAPRVGILDMATGKVTKWIPLEHKAGGVRWSPDGKRLAVTTYSGYPDIQTEDRARFTSHARTGYYLVDVDSGRKVYRPMGAETDNVFTGVGRVDVRWSRDGTLVVVPAPPGGAMEIWLDLDGRLRKAPAYEGPDAPPAGLSPDGRYYTVGDGWLATVKETRTHRTVGVEEVGMAVAWADNDRLVRWECPPDRHCTRDMGERLVLTDVAGRTRVPLTGYRYADTPRDWEPLITRR